MTIPISSFIHYLMFPFSLTRPWWNLLVSKGLWSYKNSYRPYVATVDLWLGRDLHTELWTYFFWFESFLKTRSKNVHRFGFTFMWNGGMWWRSCLWHRSTNRKVTGSISDGVTGIFLWQNPSGRTMAPVLTQPLDRNEYQGYFLWGKGGRCEGWQPYYLHVSIVLKSRSLSLLETYWLVKACNGIALLLPLPFLWNEGCRLKRRVEGNTRLLTNKPVCEQ
jgi:hypothetical protein